MASHMSDGSSASSRHISSSPVPYRVGLFDYEPVVIWKCKAKAARWISWSVDNPGRRYFKCRNARCGGYDFFAWYDGGTTSFMRELLNDLRDVVWSLRKKNEESLSVVEEGRLKAEEQGRELEAARKELEYMRNVALHNETRIVALKNRNSRLEAEKVVFMFGFLVVGFCVAMLVVSNGWL